MKWMTRTKNTQDPPLGSVNQVEPLGLHPQRMKSQIYLHLRPGLHHHHVDNNLQCFYHLWGLLLEHGQIPQLPPLSRFLNVINLPHGLVSAPWGGLAGSKKWVILLVPWKWVILGLTP